MQVLSASQASAEVPINENFETLEHGQVYGKRHEATTGLTWAFNGGRWGGFAITAATLTLTNAATNYLVVLRSSGVISTTTTVTNWNNTGEYARVYQITTAGSVVTAVQDHRAGPFGVHGPRVAGRRVRSISAAYPFVLDDQDTIVLHPAADTTARTWTIPANGSVGYPVGTELQVINQNAGGVLTIAITTDTMRLAGAGTTGSRTLAANGIATVTKITATEWIISGTGLT